MSTGLRPRRTRRQRQKRMQVASQLVPTFNFDTPVLTVHLNQPFVLAGIPQIQLDTGEFPASAAKIDDTTVALTYTTPGAAVSATIPEQLQGLRSTSGGYLTPGTFLAPVTP